MEKMCMMKKKAWTKGDGMEISNILMRDGLSLEVLHKLSFESKLGINLKKNLHYFDKESLLEELQEASNWYNELEVLHELALDYRIKSIQSINMKYNRYYPDHQTRKVFDDLLGFRSLCNDYDDILQLEKLPSFRVANMSFGKANDDGYRGVHVYYQHSGIHYPIEIQYNTYYDRQFNNWLHKYTYKKNYPDKVGQTLRYCYENGRITTEKEFKEVLLNVLSSSERCK